MDRNTVTQNSLEALDSTSVDASTRNYMKNFLSSPEEQEKRKKEQRDKENLDTLVDLCTYASASGTIGIISALLSTCRYHYKRSRNTLPPAIASLDPSKAHRSLIQAHTRRAIMTGLVGFATHTALHRFTQDTLDYMPFNAIIGFNMGAIYALFTRRSVPRTLVTGGIFASVAGFYGYMNDVYRWKLIQLPYSGLRKHSDYLRVRHSE